VVVVPVQCGSLGKTKPESSGNYGLRLEKELLLETQHLALDEGRYVNELIEEANSPWMASEGAFRHPAGQ
jgi:hypothetical protein